MKHSVRHTLAPDRAKDLLDRALGAYRQNYAEYDVATSWLDAETAEVGFKVSGTRIGGRITVCDDCYDIDVRVPWIFRPFRRKITATVDEEFRRWLQQEAAADEVDGQPRGREEAAIEGRA